MSSVAEMRHGPEGRDPRLSRDVEHWSVRSEMDYPSGIRFLPVQVPVTVEIRVRFSDKRSADEFERRVMELLHVQRGGAS